MPRTLLELVQQAANELAIPEPTQLVGVTDDQAKQLLALANREGKEFSARANSRGGWQELHKEYSFTTVSGQNAYALPSDFLYFVQRTFWDNAYKWELIGPISAQEKQVLRYGVVASGPRRKFYVRDNQMFLDPTPSASGQLIAYDYFSSAWCQSAGGTAQSRWQADSDTYKLDEDCFILGLKWRFLRSKGLDYGQEKQDYDDECQQVMSRDGGARDLPLGGATYGARFIDGANVPETGFGA